jgi:hypothetical protein
MIATLLVWSHIMEAGFYSRKLLILEAIIQSTKLKEHVFSILGSPLDLAKKIIEQCFSQENEGIKSYRENLDSIKRMALGLSSAERSAEDGDKLASYSVYQYSFQQFFQSSIRARQGHVLDRALTRILEENGIKSYTKLEHEEVLKEIGVQTSARHDIDVLGSLDQNYLLIQIRSRDDTGGTTAKGSLVELIRDVGKTRKYPNRRLLYVIYIWEPLNRQQRESLISRIRDSLQLNEDDVKILREGNTLSYGTNLDLKLVYGPVELFESLQQFFSKGVDVEGYSRLMEMLSEWDDLWLSYALATLELENKISSGVSNFEVLEEVMKEQGIEIQDTDITDYRKRSCEIAEQLLRSWRKDTICFSAPADQLNYIRDLVLLKIVHKAISEGVQNN